MGLPLKTTQKLRLVQNEAAGLLAGTSYRDHITPVLKELHWLPICFQLEFKVLVMTFKAFRLGILVLEGTPLPIYACLRLEICWRSPPPHPTNTRHVLWWGMGEGFLCGGPLTIECPPLGGPTGTNTEFISTLGKNMAF